jgi:hypothetical protein
MKNLSPFHFLLFLALISFTATSCRKGCMDSDACNYDSAAARDNGTCNYGCLDTTSTTTTTTVPGTECSSGDVQLTGVLSQVNINCFDYQIGSPYYNQAFATLHIRQDQFDHCVNGYMVAWGGYVENVITFQNITSNTASFDYQITQDSNGSVRQYQGYISNLAAGASTEVNTGDNTFYNFNGSVVQVVSANITYQ